MTRTENSIRPVALDRKNYMFTGSHERAKNDMPTE